MTNRELRIERFLTPAMLLTTRREQMIIKWEFLTDREFDDTTQYAMSAQESSSLHLFEYDDKPVRISVHGEGQ